MRGGQAKIILAIGGTGTFGRLVVGDLLMRSPHNVAAACRRGIADDCWPPGSEGRLTSHRVDATDRHALRQLVDQIKPAVIIHAAGPYFAIGSVPLQVAIETRVPYIDLCPRAFRFGELKTKFGDATSRAGIPVFIGASTVGGITGLMTRRATEQMDRVDRVETVLSVHNFGWGGGLVSDYLRTADKSTKHGLPGSRSKVFHFPDGTHRRVALGDTLEHIHSDGLCVDTTHWFGLSASLPNWSIRVAERLVNWGIPVWYAAGPVGWLSGKLGGHGTDGILVHDAQGVMNGEAGRLRTTVVRPFGNVRNPAVLAAVTARAIADGTEFETGFIHPASWMRPERIIDELTDRGNEITTQWDAYPHSE